MGIIAGPPLIRDYEPLAVKVLAIRDPDVADLTGVTRAVRHLHRCE